MSELEEREREMRDEDEMVEDELEIGENGVGMCGWNVVIE